MVTHMTFVSHGETTLLTVKGKLKLQSHLDREEYVARVLDREAKSTPPEAAKAMTVAIRTYLQQNADRDGDCLSIPDSSATQRFSFASHCRRADDDRLDAGSHLCGRSGSLSWQPGYRRDAFLAARYCPGGAGERYDPILAFAYPDNNLSRWGAPRSTCQLLPKAKAWLAKNAAVAAYITKVRRDTTNQTCLRSVV